MKFTIHLGDARTSLSQWCRPKSFDGVLTDPPYGFTAFGKRKTQDWEKEDGWTTEGRWEDHQANTALWEGIYEVLRPGAWVLAATGGKKYHRIATSIEDAGFEIHPPFAWIFTQASATGVNEGHRLKPGIDLFVMARKPGKGRLNTMSCKVNGHVPTTLGFDVDVGRMLDQITGMRTTLFFCNKATRQERNLVPTDHPTLKPLALTEYLGRLIRQKGSRRLLVPFSGVGSEVIGALRAGWEEVVGLEREEKYHRVSLKRIPAFVKGVEQI